MFGGERNEKKGEGEEKNGEGEGKNVEGGPTQRGKERKRKRGKKSREGE